MNKYSAFFSDIKDLAKFYNSRSGVAFTRDAYEFIGSYWVDFELDVLSLEDVKNKVNNFNGTVVEHFD